MRAMILAAGLGTRLRPITYELPKPMVPVLGRPVMQHIVELLARHGFREVVANLHYFPDTIRHHFGDGSAWDLELTYSFEDELLGTAGGVRSVAEFFGDEPFLVISGDALTDIDLSAMRDFHASHDGIATLALKQVPDTREYGVVILGSDGRIQGFQEKPDPAEALSDLGNCGIYMFDPEIFDYFPSGRSAANSEIEGFADWALDVYPALLENDAPFYGHTIEDYWNDVGSLDEYRQGNFDALNGAVTVGHDASPAGDGVLAVGEAPSAQMTPPVFIGAGCEIGDDVRLDGPVIVGDRAKIGAGARLRETIVWPGTEIAPDSLLIGAIAGTRDVLSQLRDR